MGVPFPGHSGAVQEGEAGCSNCPTYLALLQPLVVWCPGLPPTCCLMGVSCSAGASRWWFSESASVSPPPDCELLEGKGCIWPNSLCPLTSTGLVLSKCIWNELMGAGQNHWLILQSVNHHQKHGNLLALPSAALDINKSSWGHRWHSRPLNEHFMLTDCVLPPLATHFWRSFHLTSQQFSICSRIPSWNTLSLASLSPHSLLLLSGDSFTVSSAGWRSSAVPSSVAVRPMSEPSASSRLRVSVSLLHPYCFQTWMASSDLYSEHPCSLGSSSSTSDYLHDQVHGHTQALMKPGPLLCSLFWQMASPLSCFNQNLGILPGNRNNWAVVGGFPYSVLTLIKCILTFRAFGKNRFIKSREKKSSTILSPKKTL